MNRFQYLLDDKVDFSLIPAPPVTEPAAPPSDRENPYCLFTPQHYERNYAYPLIVWLHGPDDDQRQVTRVMPLVSLRNYVAVGPRGTCTTSVAGGYGWSQESDEIAVAEERVLAAVAAARRWLNIAPSRIYLAGYACGGTMALRVALSDPRRYAGALSIGGAFPTTLRPLSQLHAARRLNVFLAACRHSRQYPEREVCDHLRLLHSAGISVNLRLYPGDDDVTADMLADMDRWIMEQVAAEQPAAQDPASHPSRRK
ncbi:MAG: PHB depolymerase family esterase [Pirellulales bacterium]